jgi:hypothetical protein
MTSATNNNNGNNSMSSSQFLKQRFPQASQAQQKYYGNMFDNRETGILQNSAFA